jgi:hypothetical protein
MNSACTVQYILCTVSYTLHMNSVRSYRVLQKPARIRAVCADDYVAMKYNSIYTVLVLTNRCG